VAYSGFHKEGAIPWGLGDESPSPAGSRGRTPVGAWGTKMFLFRMDSGDRFAIWGFNRAYLSNSFCDMNK